MGTQNLNMQDRQQRVESSQELLEVYNANPEDFHTHLVTVSVFLCNDIQTKIETQFDLGMQCLHRFADNPCHAE